MAEETKKTTAKKTTAAKSTTTKTTSAKSTSTAKKTTAAKAAAKPAEKATSEAKVEAPKAAPAKAKKGCPKAKESNRLKDKFDNVVKAHMMEKYHYSSVMQIPHLEKIVINIGCGDATENSKVLDDCLKDLTIIAGQHPVTTKAKKSIATFKVREGQGIGCKVTLRGIKMYEFLDKLVSISLPRVRDFRGVSKNAFDGHGNYTLGIKEQLIFPEIEYDKVAKIRGMDIVIVTTAKNDDEAFTLLDELGMPFHR